MGMTIMRAKAHNTRVSKLQNANDCADVLINLTLQYPQLWSMFTAHTKNFREVL